MISVLRVVGVSIAFLVLCDYAIAAPEAERKAQVLAQRQSAVTCENMPPSLNPWGKDCEAHVAKRWAICSKASKGQVALLHDCLGFKRPLPLPGVAAFQAQMLKKWGIDLGSTLPPSINTIGDRCKEECSDRVERCGGPAITHEINTDAFARCLGFDMPPPPPPAKTLASCETPNIRVRLSATAAHAATWPGSKPHTVNGKTLYVAASAVFDERDVEKLQLEQQDTERRAWIQLSPAATKRFADASGASVGEYIVLSFDGQEIAMKVESAVTGGKLYFDAGKYDPADLCKGTGN